MKFPSFTYACYIALSHDCFVHSLHLKSKQLVLFKCCESLSRRVVREKKEACKSFAQRSHHFMNIFSLCQVTKQRSSDLI